MRVVQYPHYLFLVVPDSESVQDGDGNWSIPSSVNEYVCRCREETNGKGAYVQVAGGAFHLFSSLIQIPFGSRPVSEGGSVFVSNDAAGLDVRITGTVYKYDVGQLHNRLWL